jgi:cell division protein FtsB
MTTTTAPSAPGRPGNLGAAGLRRPRFATRRRLLAFGCFLLLVAVALAANYGPLRDYQAARARLEKTTAAVAALEKQKAALQSRSDKLSQAGYLEGLARQELAYVRPDEDLYIITGLPGEDPAAAAPVVEPTPSLGIGAAGLGIDLSGSDGTGGANGASGAEKPGLLERILSAIGGLF